MSNEDVVAIISRHLTNETYDKACDEIMTESLRRWKVEEETIDDTTFILVIFENKAVKSEKVVTIKGSSYLQ